MNAQHTAAEIVVEGDVQGVGFRNFAQRRAALLGLSGYVMNLKDGRRLRVLAEGSRELIEDLVKHLEKGPPLARVERVNVRWLASTGRPAAFDIRYAEFEP
ncbi:MAG: acylphosphatase [Candidatus Rokuibacteriota bacterium]